MPPAKVGNLERFCEEVTGKGMSVALKWARYLSAATSPSSELKYSTPSSAPEIAYETLTVTGRMYMISCCSSFQEIGEVPEAVWVTGSGRVAKKRGQLW